VQQEFPELRKKYWGCHFWGRGFFSTISGNVTEDVINEYINNHLDAHKTDRRLPVAIFNLPASAGSN